MAKQAEVPIWVIRMPKPAPHEHEMPVDPIPGDLTRVRNGTGKLFLRFRRQHFIRVENEDPFVPERKILERPILFLWPGPVKLKLHDMRAIFPRDLDRVVRALRIDDEYFVG